MSQRPADDSSRGRPADPFRALGLRRGAELADDDVRAAWRAVAAATHPDRADGGDPAAFAAAASAYARLRTAAARTEVLADSEAGAAAAVRARTVRPRWRRPAVAGLADRIRRGRPGRLALRALAAVAVAVLAVAVTGWQPASVAVITGALTWLILSGRTDLGGGSARDR